MTQHDLKIRLTGAEILRDDRLELGEITIEDGLFSENPCSIDIDASGYYVLPGIIDLHGDAFERHLAPRPTAPFAPEIGLRSTECELLANGVTTAYLAQSWSWEGGYRSPEATETLMKAVAAYRAHMQADMRVQVRFEYYLTHDGERLLQAVDKYDVDYVVFNNHLDQGILMADTKPERLANWAADNNRTGEEHLKLMLDAKATEPQVPDFIRSLGASFSERGIAAGSHDDDTPDTRDIFNSAGATICEFPINMETALHARACGNPILMGAPNVVRGGSQSGNIAAVDLIKADVCDVLVSDYYAPALSTAAWTLVDTGVLDFATAWKMISTNAAIARGWSSVGRVAPGQRADAVIMSKETRQIEGTIANGKLAFATGAFVNRMLGARQISQVAAA